MSNGSSAGGAFGGGQARAPKLEIKKDPKGMVTVPGATIVEARPPSPPPMHGLTHSHRQTTRWRSKSRSRTPRAW